MARSTALALLAALAVPGAALGATITGTVSAAKLPPPIPASLTHDRHVCGQRGPVWSSTVSADAGGRIAGAIVYLEPRAPGGGAALADKKTARPLVIDQVNCEFVPRIAAVRVGTEIRVRSSDAVFHNVHVRRLDGSTLANVSTPLAGTEVRAFVPTAAGPLLVGCDAGHHWMRADLLVLDHGFHTQSGRGGRFELEKVPPGAWWLVSWHPAIGERRVELDVRPTDRDLRRPLAYP